MKKLLIAICTALFILAAPLSAFEWGGLVTNSSGVSTPDFSVISFKQQNGLSLWFNTALGESDLFLSGEGVYKFKLVKAPEADAQIINVADLPLLKVSGDIQTEGGVISLNAGRFSYVDGTGSVFAGSIDGLGLDYTLPIVKLGFVAGYTGLLNELNVNLSNINTTPETQFYKVADTAYIPVGFSVEFPALFANQSLGLQGYGMLNKDQFDASGYYVNLLLSGPVTNSIFYNVVSSVGSVNTFKNIMLYSALSLVAFPTETLSFFVGAEYGSASGQGSFATFQAPGYSYSGDIVPKAGFTFATNDMSFDVSGSYILGYDGSKYAGTRADVNAGFIYNIFSDLQAGLAFTGQIDLTGGNNSSYNINLNVALAF